MGTVRERALGVWFWVLFKIEPCKNRTLARRLRDAAWAFDVEEP